jgi:hypothetical protein
MSSANGGAARYFSLRRGSSLADVLFFIPPSFHHFGDEVEALAVGFITGGESILVIESLVGGGISGQDTGGVGGVVSDLECQLLVFFAKGHRRFPPVVTFEKKRQWRSANQIREFEQVGANRVVLWLVGQELNSILREMEDLAGTVLA